MMTARCSIAVFARAPIPGQAKTRLIPHLGAERAARLQAILTEHALCTALEAGTGPVSLWCSPDCAHPHFEALAQKFRIPLVPQHGEDLGARMLAAFDQLCRDGNALLIGTDCPALTSQALCEASQGLAEHHASFVPAEDGGYVAVGLRRALPDVFRDIEWGSGRVMAQTRDRLRAANLRWHECPALWDVDRAEDFERLRASGVLPQIAMIDVSVAMSSWATTMGGNTASR